MSNQIVVLDDRPESIGQQLETLKTYGYSCKICSSPMELQNYLDTNKRGPAVSAIVLDMHIRGAMDLSGIGLPTVDTLGGRLAGLAVAERFLRRSKSKYRDTPLVLMSEYAEIGDEAKRLLSKSELGDVDFIGKSNTADFERFVLKLRTESAPPFSFSTVVKFEKKVSDGDFVSIIQPAYAQIVRAICRDPKEFYNLSPRQWEEMIAAAYLREGFNEVVLTPRSGDLGRDVVAIKHGLLSIKFIEQVKAYHPGHLVTAEEVRALLGVLTAEQNASKGVFTTTSAFAPRLTADRLIKPFLPHRLQLVDKRLLLKRLSTTLENS